jgi:anti-sigma factor RsiW
VQPVQLSLMPDQVPAPAPSVLAQLPDQQVAAAVSVLATLIAKTVNPSLVPAVDEEAGGE